MKTIMGYVPLIEHWGTKRTRGKGDTVHHSPSRHDHHDHWRDAVVNIYL